MIFVIYLTIAAIGLVEVVGATNSRIVLNSTYSFENVYGDLESVETVLSLEVPRGIWNVVGRNIFVTETFSLIGSGSSTTSLVLSEESLSKFQDGDQIVQNVSLSQRFGLEIISGGGLQVGNGRTLGISYTKVLFMKALVSGGGISSIGGDLSISSSEFIGCSAAFGGGVYVFGGDTVYIVSSEFIGGSGHSGQGLYISDTESVYMNGSVVYWSSGRWFGITIIENSRKSGDGTYNVIIGNSTCGKDSVLDSCRQVMKISSEQIVDCQNVSHIHTNSSVCSLSSEGTRISQCLTNEYRDLNGTCRRCKVCGNGYYSERECTSNENTVCVGCSIPSTYHWKFSGSGCLWECDSSSGFYKNSSTERCEKCPSGRYLNGGSCEACSVCSGGQSVISECFGEQDTVCSDCSVGLPEDGMWISSGIRCEFVCVGGKVRRGDSCVSALSEGVNGTLLYGSISNELLSLEEEDIPSLDAGKITSGSFGIDRIPLFGANKITSGVFDVGRIPDLSASKITTGTLNSSRLLLSESDIPELDASKIDSGTFDDGRIPDLSAGKITSGTLGIQRIPSLYAGNVTSGTFETGRIPVLTTTHIPDLAASKIDSGVFDVGRIPDLSAAKLTSGTVADARLDMDWIGGLWTDWSACTETSCGTGRRMHYRSVGCPIAGRCTGAKPSTEGSVQCVETTSCTWTVGNWGSYGSCSLSCGTGTKTRSRSVSCPITDGCAAARVSSESGVSCSGSSCLNGSLDTSWDSDGILVGGSGHLYDIVVDSNENVIAVGYRSLSGRGADALIVKYSSSGSLLVNVTNGSSSSERLRAIDVDSSGILYSAGQSDGYWGGSGVGSWDSIVWSVNASGSHRWIFRKGASGADIADGIRVKKAVFVVGHVAGVFTGVSGHGVNDFYVMKLTLAGSEEWIFQYGTSGNDYTGWIGNSLAISDSVLFVSGYTQQSWQGLNAGDYDLILLRLNFTGSQLSVNQTGSSLDDNGYGLSFQSSFIYQSGCTRGSLPSNSHSGGTWDAFVIQYFTNGTRNWIRQFGTNSSDRGDDCSCDPAENVYVTGYTAGDISGLNSGSWDIFVVSYDSSGSSRFQLQFGSSGADYNVGIVFHQNAIFVGSRYNGSSIVVAKAL